MEYQFIDDPITGSLRAKFSFEHEVIGPWLEVEVGKDLNKIAMLLAAVTEVEQGKKADAIFIGSEYTTVINIGEVMVQSNSSMNNTEALSDMLVEEKFDFDQQDECSCGSEDFIELMNAWKKFVSKY